MTHRSAICAAALLSARLLVGQTDPGPRPGSAGAGGFYPALNPSEQAAFNAGFATFNEVDSVSGTMPGESGNGLGPTFNGNSCAMCHAQPAVGGSSPGLASPQKPVPNPQVALATLDHAANTLPSFITTHGPVREARFISTNPSNPSAPLDGGVHGIFTIKGRTDAPGCPISQPDFAGQLAEHNVIFRIPTPTFGLGLVENTPDSALQANLASTAGARAALGIAGTFNTSGNDGSITRFGWKAQNKSLLVFAGEAYNVEQGVSNIVFPNERAAVSGCVFNATPEDMTDVTNFAAFMRLSAPPAPATTTASQKNGQALFATVGCALCHSPALTTGKSIFTGMSNVTYHPYSDFALHNMGSNLADGVNQGGAGPTEFRTAPLWGVGQRLYFLHDGRTSDLLDAIEEHASPGFDCVSGQSSLFMKANANYFRPFVQSSACGSEANEVIEKFNSHGRADQQDILNFLRSL
jgi:mono/diheme cytochrome c family protein